MSLAVNGFINDLARQFPMEYSVELKRLIDLEMEGSASADAPSFSRHEPDRNFRFF